MRLFPALLAALALAFLANIGLGELTLHPRDIWAALTGRDGAAPVTATILWELRLPRATLAVLVGAALAVAGAVTQAVMRNPLAEPGILGINSGAALAAMVVIVGHSGPSEIWLPWLSFAGALVMSIAIYALAWREGTNSLRIILIGIGLGSLAGAGAGFIAAFGTLPDLQRAMIWLAGSLQDSRWVKSAVLAGWLVLPFATVWIAARELDLITYGDEIAQGPGQRVDLVRGALILATAMIAGAAVSAAGLVAFVGLTAPHIARALTGRSHARLLPATALVGAVLVLLADVAARRAFAPVQLPVGLMTALLGTPFFAYLFWKKRNG